MTPMTREELSRWYRDPGDLGVWEDIASWFHKETGHLRPGKDKPPGFHDTAWGESDCCMDAWVVWRSEKQDAAVAGLRARVAELEADLRWVLAYVDAIVEGKPADSHDDDARWARVRSV